MSEQIDDDGQEFIPYPCEHEIALGTLHDPPAFCENDALPGSEFCEAHDPDFIEDRLVERAEAAREDTYL